jgi:prepilin-type N-terminal cleavage/methylation domain-containing protein
MRRSIFANNSSCRNCNLLLRTCRESGFTIVEILVVIVVIGVLATITVIAYTGMTQKASLASIQSDSANASKKLNIYQIYNGMLPDLIDCSSSPVSNSICLEPSGNSSYTSFSSNSTGGIMSYCLTVENNGQFYQFTDSSALQEALSDADCNGLRASYFSNTGLTGDPVFEDIESNIHHNWGSGSPLEGFGADNFSVRYSGYITTTVAGTYTFYVTSDDGQRLYVDGSLIVDDWILHGPTTRTATVSLGADEKVPIVYDMFESGGGAVAELEWMIPGGSREIIPNTALSYN